MDKTFDERLEEATRQYEEVKREMMGLFSELLTRYSIASANNKTEIKQQTYESLKKFYTQHNEYLTDWQIKRFKEIQLDEEFGSAGEFE